MTMEAGTADPRAMVLAFLETVRRPERPLAAVADDDHLVESGVIDSLAMIGIVMFLEHQFGLSFRDSGLDPERLATIGRILELIAESPR
jgi:acyl carrier protein